MKQLFFDGKGKLLVQDVPAPGAPDKGALVRVYASLISSGTEMTAASGGGSLIRKAIEQPQLIGRAIQLALREGIGFTAGEVKNISETWFPTGYSSAGQVVASGINNPDLRAGDRVAGAGAGFANHAEYNAVPRNLLATIPDNVSYKQAAFTTVGAIALQGVRRAEVTLGETVVVIGLGLIGQMVAQILDASGCRVIGSDLLPERRELAAKLAGAATIDPTLGDVADQVMALTNGIGADKVILCAATRSSSPVNEAFKMCRERGRVVMVGAMGMDLDRPDFYNKELDFLISRSVGPGRYDKNYEEEGIDYPIGFVRWTEQRNMAAFLQLIGDGKLDIDSLITETFPVTSADKAYEAVSDGALGVLLTYGDPDEDNEATDPRRFILQAAQTKSGKVGLALVGAGIFARAVHLPNIKSSKHLQLQAVVSGSASAAQVAQKHKAQIATTDLTAALTAPEVDAVLISTRHNLHGAQAVAAAQAGKHVFIEKPMALTIEGCEAILNAVDDAGVLVTVGFNRRMAPAALALKSVLDNIKTPKMISFRVNAGPLPQSHWLNDPAVGGGRMLGEGVHFIDFICGILDSNPVSVSAQGNPDGQDFVITMRFSDGSTGVVIYTSYGDPQFPKEYVEVFAGGGVAVLNDFKTLSFTGMKGKDLKGSQDKGHQALLDSFGAAIQGKSELTVTGLDGLRATQIALAAEQSIREGTTVTL